MWSRARPPRWRSRPLDRWRCGALPKRPATCRSSGTGPAARGIIGAEYDPDTTGKLQKPNIVRNLVRDVVDTPRITGTRRYLFANPSEAPVIEVAFLDGVSDPYLEVQDGFDVDGARYKVRLDFGIAAIDYRGAVTNAGA
ncbi:MAG: hypothetical protein JNJ72_20570 [Anaerolineales bacterium]|nr:hypothetical protein [Anaerolineales bacterium]